MSVQLLSAADSFTCLTGLQIVCVPPGFLFVFGATSPRWARASSFTRFLDHTQRRTTVGRTPLDEWSARRRDLYLATQNTQNRHVSMTLVGFEPTLPTGERPQTYALDRAATGTDTAKFNIHKFHVLPHTLYLCVWCGSENKQRLFPSTAWNDWFV